MLTNQTRTTLVQLLNALSPDAVHLLLVKHLDLEIWPITTHHLLDAVSDASPEGLAGLLVELLGGKTAIRKDAPTKYVFDGRLSDLTGRLLADGYEVFKDALVRLMPAAEPAAQISDYLETALVDSGLDLDGKIQRLLQDSHRSMSATPPDLNDATTKARIALETIARRSATSIANARGIQPPEDRWGSALLFLGEQAVIARAEEDALAKVYTLISPGAHVLKGLTEEQWALLAKTFAISGTYFLLRQYQAA